MADFLQSMEWQDYLDILLLTFIFYRILTLVKGTRTIPILLGFSLVLALYLFSNIFQLEAIGLVLNSLANSLVLVLVILFQAEIRNALAQFGLITFFSGVANFNKDVIDEAIQGAFMMSRERIGALIVFEREVGLRNFIEKGTSLDAVTNKEILLSIFRSTSPLHDGAVIIDRKGRLAAARCLLPITSNTKISPILGTRHRAAIGLTEETDAVVLVVSEERSEVSLSYKGELMRESSHQNIKTLLFDLMDVKSHPLQAEPSSETRDVEPLEEDVPKAVATPLV